MITEKEITEMIFSFLCNVENDYWRDEHRKGQNDSEYYNNVTKIDDYVDIDGRLNKSELIPLAKAIITILKKEKVGR